MNRRLYTTALALSILGFVAIIYWPISHAGFVWVDKTLFQNAAWLRYGAGWKQLIFHHFYDWVNYFRPLVVAAFVAEVRVFDVSPGAMHLVSLALHLGNTCVVGMLALRLTMNNGSENLRRILSRVAMLLYGLHPALIEPVVWISCQAEQLVTFFWLLGLLVNFSVRATALRAVAVAVCFFLAACAKESAAGFPLTLTLLDWISLGAVTANTRPLCKVGALLRRQWPTYLAVAVSGIAYLALRYWAMGFLTQGSGAEPLLSWSRVQTVCYLFLTYWRVLVWPMVELGPLHIVDTRQFATVNATLLVVDIAALGILCAGAWLVWKRRVLGGLIAAVGIALLPVLHIIPVDFDLSLYHERYAMTATAMACALLPGVLTVDFQHARSLLGAVMASTLVAIWLALGIANIRITVPLWSDDSKLWSWELTQHPDSILAQDHLLAVYVERDDRAHAHVIADLLLKEKPACADCMLNVAALAVNEGDVPRLQAALELARPLMRSTDPVRQQQAFITAMGQLHELQGDAQAAIYAYQDAIRMDALQPLVRMDLALLLARQGKTEDARNVMEVALPLFAPDQRDQRRKEFEAALNALSASTPTPSQP